MSDPMPFPPAWRRAWNPSDDEPDRPERRLAPGETLSPDAPGLRGRDDLPHPAKEQAA